MPINHKKICLYVLTAFLLGLSHNTIAQKKISKKKVEALKKEVAEVIAYYLENARIMKQSLAEIGYTVFGGDNAPYVWVKTKNNATSWEFFDKVLNEANVVGTPGSGFGPAGEGYFRFSAIADRENVLEAMERIKNLSWSF